MLDGVEVDDMWQRVIVGEPEPVSQGVRIAVVDWTWNMSLESVRCHSRYRLSPFDQNVVRGVPAEEKRQ